MLAIEPVRAGDVDPVARLALRALQEQYDPEWLASQAQSSGTFLVARDVPTNHIVGFAVANRDACEAHLLAIAVERQRRGEGIGSALLSNVRDELARAGAFRLSLEVRADDPGAQAFYQRHGFWPDGLQSRVYSDGGDAVKMTRPL
ncbi:MAG: GNAT family N-acetyltransferase [bacterium]